MQKKEVSNTPVLYIKNLQKEFLYDEVLEQFMASRRRCNGGEIETWIPQSPDMATGLGSVQVIYKDPAGI